MQGVKARHPSITEQRLNEWRLIRDCMGGESEIKVGGERYLPKPSGFKNHEGEGRREYADYVARAQFPELLTPSVSAMLGIIHGNKIDYEIPKAIEHLLTNVDGRGLTLAAFHKRITRELLTIGGYGILADAPERGGDPYLAGFTRDKIINWDEGFWVLDESGLARDGFEWDEKEQYRVLRIEDGRYVADVYEGELQNAISIDPRARGDATLDSIPFAVANSLDVSEKLEAPPLIGVANAAKAIYQLSADYRLQLYMSGQETLVAINGDAPTYVGALVVHEMRGSDDATPDLKYVSPTCAGIGAHKDAMKDAREAAVMAGARLFEQSSGGKESGEAKRLRYASETATLESVAQSSCSLLERSLKNAAIIAGANENEVNVAPPADLMDRTMSPQDFATLFGVYTQGATSWETFFANGKRGGMYPADRTAEEELSLIEGPMGQEQVV